MASRREFIKTLAASSAGLLLTTLSFRNVLAEEKKKKKEAGGGALPADPKKGKAKELNYVPDRAKVTDAKLKVEKMGVPFNKQDCKNCVLYKPTGGGHGICMLMQSEPEHIVAEIGWCTSWAKNPNVPV